MTDSPHFDVSTDEAGVVWITMDVEGKSVNVMTQAVTADFCAIIDEIAAHPPTGLVFRSGKARGFIFGADVNEFADFAHLQYCKGESTLEGGIRNSHEDASI